MHLIEYIRGYVALDGQMIVVAPNGQYLGILISDFNHSDSICNANGKYGNPHSPTSTNNQHSQYGGTHGIHSPYNPHCINPPRLIINQTDCGALTNNPYLQGDKHDLNLIVGILLGAAYGASTNQRPVIDQMALNHQQHQFELAKMQMQSYEQARRDAVIAATGSLYY